MKRKFEIYFRDEETLSKITTFIEELQIYLLYGKSICSNDLFKIQTFVFIDYLTLIVTPFCCICRPVIAWIVLGVAIREPKPVVH